MFLDSQLQFSDSQAVTTTAVGTNTVDLSVARSIGSGNPIAVVFVVEVAADQTTGDEDYTFDVEYSSSADQSTGYRTVGRAIFESGTPDAPARNADVLVAGATVVVLVPPVTSAEDERYIGVRYTTAGTTPTITVSAYLQAMDMIDNPKAVYASGYDID